MIKFKSVLGLWCEKKMFVKIIFKWFGVNIVVMKDKVKFVVDII